MRGTKVFVDLHGRTYPALAAELRAVPATRALGVSMGAGGILATIGTYARVVLVLPPSGSASDVHERLADAIDTADLGGIAHALRDLQPAGIRDRDDVTRWAEQRARELAGTDVAAMIRALAGQRTDRRQLPAYAGRVLVIAQEDDPVHPVEVAIELAESFPESILETFPPGGLLWTHRARVREVIAGFLDAE